MMEEVGKTKKHITNFSFGLIIAIIGLFQWVCPSITDLGVSTIILGLLIIAAHFVHKKTKKIDPYILFLKCLSLVAVVLPFILLPLMEDTVQRAKEAKTKGNLAVLRFNVSLYYGENKVAPERLDLLVEEYNVEIPVVMLDKEWAGENNNTWKLDPTPDTGIMPGDLDNSTAWIYNNSNELRDVGVNNTGSDSKDEPYRDW